MIEQIIQELADHKDGLSYWEVWKEINRKYKANVDKSAVRYHLNKLHSNGLIDKVGPKYRLKGVVVGCDGVLLFTTPPAIVNCPYYNTCRTKGCLKNDGCKLLEKLGPEFLEFLESFQ